jgi:hypothetical protein
VSVVGTEWQLLADNNGDGPNHVLLVRDDRLTDGAWTPIADIRRRDGRGFDCHDLGSGPRPTASGDQAEHLVTECIVRWRRSVQP